MKPGNIHLDTGTTNSRRESRRIFLENQKGLFHHLTTRFQMPVERQMTIGPCQETSYAVITLNPESNFARREKNYYTHLDVKQEKRIDDYLNIDGSRDLSGSWTRFTQFTLLSEKPPDGFLLSGRRLTIRQATSRPDHLWPEPGRNWEEMLS